MDFGTLLHMAKKNNDSSKQSSSYYSTKYAPPKKESKEKKLSDNIQKFLHKREQEENERKRLEREKVNNLLSMRDEKSKNKIRKMLKVTKSANKSVLDDAISSETAVTMEGPQMGDQDDYGYVSTTANAFYQKYIEKVKDVKEDKGFAPSRPQSVSDLKGTKERVKAAITREIEDKKGSRQRTSTNNLSSSDKSQSKITSFSSSSSSSSSRKNLYDAESERLEEERKKREEQQKRAKQRKPAPPPMDFQALLKLAEKKQHEPIELPVEVKKPKEPERLLTSKEKRELEERRKAKEAREKRDKEREQGLSVSSSKDKERKESAAPTGRMEPNGRIPKLNQTTKPSDSEKDNTTSKYANSTQASKTAHTSKNLNASAQEKALKKPATTASTSSSAYQSKSVSASSKPSTSSSTSLRRDGASSSSSASRRPYDGPTREFPPRDNTKSRPFPPPDVRRSAPTQPSYAHKRRIADDTDEEDYDSEMDDFIDDGDAEEDYSKHIKAIFGYDKSRYRDEDFDDREMESNFAQVQREEFISKKIGLQEDLEDMKLEAIEKKRKIMKKKRMQ